MKSGYHIMTNICGPKFPVWQTVGKEATLIHIPHHVMRTASATTPQILEFQIPECKKVKNPQYSRFWIPTTGKLRVKKNQWDAPGSMGAECLQLDLSIFLSTHLHPHDLSSTNFYVST